MPHANENPGVGAPGVHNHAHLSPSNSTTIAPNHAIAQAENRPSAAVAAAIQRNHVRLLGIKRESISRITLLAAAHLDEALEALENADDPEFFQHVKPFLDHARAIAKLANDLRETREARQ